MQIDMHYYGTYAMARAAGIRRDAAAIIATAAQFTDDNASKDSIEFRDGGRLDAEATAHHAIDRKNIDAEDQRKIWVPFHFLPGNQGNFLTEKLVCRKDSDIAKQMVRFNLSLADQPYALPLMGITAHVYADTFAHYGFSGISSRRNKIHGNSFKFDDIDPEMEKYIRGKEKKFEENYPDEGGFLPNIKSWFAEKFSGALGHGAALTFPDRPYLKWSFEYEEPEKGSGLRDNPATYLEGCEALHKLFRDFATARQDCAETAFAEFSDIKGEVEKILNLQAPKKDRIKAWQDASTTGNLFATGPEKIPLYRKHNWHNQRENLVREKDSSKTRELSVYNFYQAAAVYRTYVLRVLLPSKGLVVT
ncbi:hypothetical protein DENIS_1364 [Desulfonema ishimotonii]|uniref:Uncharacterized protein n=1 Tax=Desulfonema ishimotonii TaxID=45657 RepID=A0A401FTV8_9BACT|nr:DUF6765 family protein [Desulfonema ishimotonii]GBC60412.1 hypothetical protein DENIS_1364 [Desulfonema ishimotonii]